MNLEHLDDETIVLEPRTLDSAIVSIDMRSDRLIYDYDLLIEAFMRDNDWDISTAAEWVDYNVCGSYVENGPIISYSMIVDDEMDELMRLL